MKKLYKIAIVLLVVSETFLCTATAQKTDSLKNILAKEKRIEPVFNLYIEIGNEFRSVSIDSAIAYHQKAMDWANVKMPYFKKLKAENELSYDYIKNRDLENGKWHLKKVNKNLQSVIAKKESPAYTIEIKKTLSLNYEYLGLTARKEDSLFLALDYFEKAISVAEAISELEMLSVLYNDMAQTLYMQGMFPKSLDYCLKGIKVNQQRNDKQGIASSTGNAGILFKEIGDYEKALSYFQTALELNEELGNKRSIAINLGNIGVAYDHLYKYDLAFEYYLKAANIHEELGNKEGLIYNYNNIGLAYRKKKKYNKSIEYFLKSLEFAEEIQDNYAIAHTCIYLGGSYNQLKNYPVAQTYLDKSFAICQRMGALDIEQEFYEEQSSLYQNTGQFEKALTSYRKFIEIRDSVLNESNLRKVIQLESNLKFEKRISEDSAVHAKEIQLKKAEVDRKNAEVDRKNAELRADQNLQYALYGGLGLFALFILFIYNRFKITKKQNKIIHRQKELVEYQKKEIVDSINYAKRIQHATLAQNEQLQKSLKDFLVIYSPKDIVSGDFYWCVQKPDAFFLAVCDSTGHGVPGAFMSILNGSFLFEAVNEKNLSATNEILNYVRRRLIENMEGGKDGMDATLIKIKSNQNSFKLEYAAANNAPVLIREGEIIELVADKMPVGSGAIEESFNSYETEIKKGDYLFLLTDGFADQFGGPKGKKYKLSNLKKLLQENYQLHTNELKSLLQKEFDTWKGELEQVDDVCIIGIKF